ncbi:MAG: helix-turn-helix domain-containing protein [Gammaproteobacteria bacterium]
MNALLEQLKKRRKQLKLKQADMMQRAGMSRQQYQHLESRGNPRLDTLELVAKGLKSELMLVPAEKRLAVMAVLEEGHVPASSAQKNLAEDPWQGLLENEP